jgi:hypothetical protein
MSTYKHICLVMDAGSPVAVSTSRLIESLPHAPARHIHQPADLRVPGQSRDAVNHDHVGGAG